MNALLLKLLALLAADPNMPCNVGIIQAQEGKIPAFYCGLSAPLPLANLKAIPPELADLLKHAPGDGADAPQPPAAPPPSDAEKEAAPAPHADIPDDHKSAPDKAPERSPDIKPIGADGLFRVLDAAPITGRVLREF